MFTWIGRSVTFCALVLAPTSLQAQPVPCPAKDGKGIVVCVEQTYPTWLVANISVSDRKTNTEFLRDRIIETARCAGLDVGHNLKRGGPTVSPDFIAWRVDGHVEGVDIAAGYDDVSQKLRLMWHTYSAPDYGFPTYKAYGPVSCVIDPPSPPPPSTDTEVAKLREELGAIKATLYQLGSLFNNNARMLEALKETFLNEQSNRKQVDDDLNRMIDVLKSRPIPDGCKVQFLGCRLTFNAPVIP